MVSHPSLIPARAFVFVCLAVLAAAQPAAAVTWRVDRTDDEPAATACDDATPNDCSLRGAVVTANAAPDPGTIDLPAGTYALSQPGSCGATSEVTLCLGNVHLRGGGAQDTVIDANERSRVIYVGGGAHAEIEGVTITKGFPSTFSFGGGIFVDGNLTLVRSAVRANAAIGAGGGIYFDRGAVLIVRESTIAGNSAGYGAGLAVAVGRPGRATLVDSTFEDNAAATEGGAVFIGGTATVITGCTFRGNTATEEGGAIFTGTPVLAVTNTTFSGNVVAGVTAKGGAIFANFGDVSLNNVTITENRTEGLGGALHRDQATVRLRNTIVAGNVLFGSLDPSAGPDCRGALVSEGHNLVGDATSCSVSGDTTGNLIGVDPLLGTLAENGGVTMTHAPTAGSPALEGGSPAPPGSGSGACAASDQRGFLRPEGERCDIGAVERPAGFAVIGVEPAKGGNAGSITARVFGAGFVQGATARLARTGQQDVLGDPVRVDLGGSALATRFDLSGRAPGAWDLVVRNPDGTNATQAGAFVVESGGGPDVWVDITGPSFVRPTRTATFGVYVGNRGSSDALGVPLSLSFPAGASVAVYAALADPPAQAGAAFEDWDVIRRQVVVVADRSYGHVPLLFPSIPAGTSTLLRVAVTVPADAEDEFLHASVGDPLLGAGVDPAQVAQGVAAAKSYLEREAGVPLPASILAALDAKLTQHLTGQLEAIRADALQAVGDGLGGSPRAYAQARLLVDLAHAGAVHAGEAALAQIDPALAPLLGSALQASNLADVLALLGPTAAGAAIRGQSCPPKGESRVLGEATSSGKGCLGDQGPDDIGPEGPPREPCIGLAHIFEGIGNLDGDLIRQGMREREGCEPTEPECESLPDHLVVVTASGKSICVPRDKDRCKTKCEAFPLRPRTSHDPNDKVGRLGSGGGERFLSDRAPFGYTVYFENVETAGAAAQEVVITDALDTARLDLATLSLGPIAFADRSFVPAPGTQAWSGGVDLRPEQNLIVMIDAALDEPTGVVTWRFRSLDPDTLQLTDDPLAGFLPPNVTPPEGDGSVSFTIAPKAGLVDGDAVCNGASIVFDTNEPIVTPTFCNTLDETPPTSRVETLPPVSSAAPFTVRWSSTDATSGVSGTTVFVSENGQSYDVFVNAGPGQTSAEFTPKPGTLYAFYSVAADAAGNLEAEPDLADAETTTEGAGGHDLAVLAVKAPRRVALTAKRPRRSGKIELRLQNRSPHPETIGTLEQLRALATIWVDSLGSCRDASAVLLEAPLAKKLPIVWKPKKVLRLPYDVLFECVNDAGKGAPDYEVRARVSHLALGSADAHPQDDFCPRTVTPPGEPDPLPDGKIIDRGCGASRPDRTRGGPVLIDVTGP